MMNAFNTSQEVFTRLKFIGKIQVNEKINTRNYLSILEQGWVTSILRRFYSFETRSDTIAFISDTINNSLYLIEKLRDGRSPESFNDEIVLENLIIDLKQSTVGLRNLIKTYFTDLAFVCRIETIIQNIELCLRKIDDEKKDMESLE